MTEYGDCYICRVPVSFSEKYQLFIHEKCGEENLEPHFHLWTPAPNGRSHPSAYFRRTSYWTSRIEAVKEMYAAGFKPGEFLILPCECESSTGISERKEKKYGY